MKIKYPNLNSESQDSDIPKKKNPALWVGFNLKVLIDRYLRKQHTQSRIKDF